MRGFRYFGFALLLAAPSLSLAPTPPVAEPAEAATDAVDVGHLRISYRPGNDEPVNDVVITVTAMDGDHEFVGVTDDVGWVGISAVPVGHYLIRPPESTLVAPQAITVQADQIHEVTLRPEETTAPDAPVPPPPPSPSPAPIPTTPPATDSPIPSPRSPTAAPMPPPAREASEPPPAGQSSPAPPAAGEDHPEPSSQPPAADEAAPPSADAPSSPATPATGPPKRGEPASAPSTPPATIPATGSPVPRLTALAAALLGFGLAALRARRATDS